MAKPAQTTTRAQTIKIVAPPAAPSLATRAKGAAAKGARRAGRNLGRQAIEEKHRTGAFVGALVIGYLDKNSVKFPTVPMLGRAGTVALAAYIYHRNSKSQMASHLATGAGCIALYELVSKGSISGEVDGDGPE